MAKSKYNNIEYAIKFYISQHAFQAETNMYAQRKNSEEGSLAQFLPLVRFQDMKPETLWMRKCNPDSVLVSLESSRLF